MKRHYVVGVKLPSDWEEIHKLLTQDGTLEDNIPVRSCCCVDEKVFSPTRSTYLLDEEEAELLKGNDKVEFVEIDYTYHAHDEDLKDHFPRFETFNLGNLNRFQQSVKAYRNILGEVPLSASSTELNRTNWGVLRSNSKEDPWNQSQYEELSTFAEYGTATISHLSSTISYSGDYIDPVIIISDLSYAGASAASVRILDINTTTKTFQIAISETSELDGVHTNETIHWMILDVGNYEFSDGSRIFAGKVNTAALAPTTFTTVSFSADLGSDVNVLTQVMTNAEPGWLVTRTTNITRTSFQVGMQEEQLTNSGTHLTETIGWIAFNPINVIVNNTLVQGGTFLNSINDTISNFSFTTPFQSTPTLFTKVSSFTGSDPCNSRVTTKDGTGFSALVQEELTVDAEITHTVENLTYFAIQNQQGTLQGRKFTNPYYFFSVDTVRSKFLQSTPKYFSGQDGSGTDCIIVDDGVWLGHPEFVSDDGISQVKDVILDGPYYIDPDYFINTGQIITFLGRTTCSDQAAINWWTNSNLRSPQFQSIGTIPGLSVNNYSRSLICGDYSQLPAYVSTYPEFSGHGTPCAGLMYGKTFGWAFNSNKWSITQQLGDILAGVSIPQAFEILLLFHQNKPKYADSKVVPSIISNSWGVINTVASEFTSSGFYQFREGAIGSFTSKASAPEFLKNFSSSNNSRYSRYLNPLLFSSFIVPGEELVAQEGVFFFASAGNDNQKQVNFGDPDYNNWWATVNNPTETQKEYVNRRGFPAQLGYDAPTNTYKTFSVGSLDHRRSWIFAGTEFISSFSNSGTTIDCISPGDSVLTAHSTSNTFTYSRWDNNTYYNWLNFSPVNDCYFSGTSASCPIAAGLLASVLSANKHWTPSVLKSYLSNVVENQTSQDLYIGPDSTSVTDANSIVWQDTFTLYGQEPKIVYNAEVLPLLINQDLNQSYSTIYGNSLSLSVLVNTTDNPLANTFEYQWQIKKLGELTFKDIPGEVLSTLTINSIDTTYDQAEIRCYIISDGPYSGTYSNIATIGVVVGTIQIDSNPEPNVNILEGEVLELSVSASLLDVSGSISYQWKKLIVQQYQDIPDETNSIFRIDQASVSDSGEYVCELTNPNSINSPLLTSPSTVVVSPIVFIDIISQSPSTTSLIEGDNLSLFVDAEITGLTGQSISYVWQKQNTNLTWSNIPGANSSTYSLSSVSLSSGGKYRCVLLNQLSLNSPLISSIFQVVVSPLPIITILGHPNNISQLIPRSAVLSVLARTGTSGSISYQWQKSINNGVSWNNIPGANSSTLLFQETSVSDSGLYRCYLVDNLATNSPLYSNSATVSLYSLFITQDPASQSIILNSPLTFSISTSNSSGNTLLYQWQVSKDNGATWSSILGANTSSYNIASVKQSDAGLYRCRVIDPIDSVFPIFSAPAELSVIAIGLSVVSQPIDSKIYLGGSISLSTLGALSNGQSELITYQWQKLNNLNDWVDIPGADNTTYEIVSLSFDDIGFYRCKLSYALSYQSPIFTEIAEITEEEIIVSIKETPSGITIYPDPAINYIAYVIIESNYPDLITYQWQKLDIQTQTWIDITGETNSTIDIDQNFTDNYLLRCVVNNSLISSEIFIVRQDTNAILFNDNCGYCITQSQIEELNQICATNPIKDRGCSREDLNTCGIDIEYLLFTYSFYNYQKGNYKLWGDIPFNWSTDQVNDTWAQAEYVSEFSYFLGDRVLLIEDDGYMISLYEATQNVPSISGAFDETKWKKLCHIILSNPIAPEYSEIKNKYLPYNLDLFEKDWADYSTNFESDLMDQTINNCLSANLTTSEFEKCVRTNSSDKWNEARIKKEFFYKRGDIIAQESSCGDLLCLYIAKNNIPANMEYLEENSVFSNKDPNWQKIYCISTGYNKCLDYRRTKTPHEGYEVLELGSKGHKVEVPKPYSIKKYPDLNQLSRQISRKILSPLEILDIEGKQSNYREDCDN